MGYLSNFIVYTLAMVGIIILALFVFKYTTGYKIKKSVNTKGLKVTDSLNLSPRKTLYVIETDGERFLIAGDADRTTLISKLDSVTLNKNNFSAAKEIRENKQNLGIYSTQKTPYDSVLKSLAEKIRE